MALGNLYDDFATDRVEFWNVLDGDFLAIALPLLCRLIVAHDFDAAVVRRGEDVPIVKEGVLGFTDIDECGFEARFEILDTTFKDGAHFAGFTSAFDFEFF